MAQGQLFISLPSYLYLFLCVQYIFSLCTKYNVIKCTKKFFIDSHVYECGGNRRRVKNRIIKAKKWQRTYIYTYMVCRTYVYTNSKSNLNKNESNHFISMALSRATEKSAHANTTFYLSKWIPHACRKNWTKMCQQ